MRLSIGTADSGVSSRPSSTPVLPLRSRLAARESRLHVVAQASLLALLYAVPALMAVHAAVVSDPDVGWHLRTGEWIVGHRSVPHTDLYSRFGMGQPWAAYSWMFEVLLFELFHHLGLSGIVFYTAGMLIALAAALYHLLSRSQADFSRNVLLAFAACFCCARLDTPRPWLFSILFFVLELDILLQARRTGRVRELFWLPPLFALWANLHIQFADGLLLLLLTGAEALLARHHAALRTRMRPVPVVAMAALCLLATLCNPYGLHLYGVAHDLAAQPGVLNRVAEMQALPFRDGSDYLLLAFTLAAFAVLARNGRLLSFEGALLSLATVASFRSQRDIWLVAVVAVSVLASEGTTSQATARPLPRGITPLLLGLASLLVLLGARVMHVTPASLQDQLARNLPVGAVEAIQAQGYEAPLFNDYAWGGYLIWKLGQPVSLDGRAAFYGDDRIARSDATWSGKPDWASDPQLRSANVVVGPVSAPLIQLLRLDGGFQLVYEDSVAAVFRRRVPVR